MTQSRTTGAVPSADHLMRHLLNTAGRLQQACRESVAAAAQSATDRQHRLAETERSARQEANVRIASAPEMADSRSLGSRLRGDLGKLPGVAVEHYAAAQVPTSFDEALAEWVRLAPEATRAARAFERDVKAWNDRFIKRARSRPQVSNDLWRSLDRLDLIHRSTYALAQSWVADAVRAAADEADVVAAADQQQRRAHEQALAAELDAARVDVDASIELSGAPWDDVRWASPTPATSVQRLIRLGEFCCRLPAHIGTRSLPALMQFPMTAGLAVDADVTHRDSAIDSIRAFILRALAAAPPGTLHMKVVDPVALGRSVAEFRHLSDFDPRLMDEKTWTAERDVERLMDDLAEHLQIVISKYLRGQFDNVDEYNAQAGELVQPYRLLVVLDYPVGFSDHARRQLLSLIENGPRCGVYTVLQYDSSSEDPDRGGEPALARLVNSMQKLVYGAPPQDRDARPFSAFQLGDIAALELPEPVGPVPLPLVPDACPPLTFDKDGEPLTPGADLLSAIGGRARDALSRPPTVTLSSLLPALARQRSGALPDVEPGSSALTLHPATWWHASTARGAVAPLGRSGVQDVVSMHFSSTEVAGGAIMVGIPRSGKTTSLHALVVGMAMLYSPEELELYLIDAKHGVEFKPYEALPHARMVSIRSDREFSLAILQSLDREIRVRAERMKAHGAGLANVTEYRLATGETLPRIVAVIDEFHELFEQPDAVGLAAFDAFSNIVRMGPFSGVHLVVASQTLSSMPAMDRPTLTLLPQRVAFMCTEYDAEIVMGETNKAVRLLTRTGEGLFNPARGEEPRNQLFQGLHIPTDQRAELLAQMRALAADAGWTREPIVYDGDELVTRPTPTAAPGRRRTVIQIGQPYSLDATSSLVLSRARGSNLLILGDVDDDDSPDPTARAAAHSVLISAQSHGVQAAVVDFLGDEKRDGAASLMAVAEWTGARYARSRSLSTILAEFAREVAARSDAENYRSDGRLLLLYGVQRAVELAPVDPYASVDDQPDAARLLGVLLSDGPEVGVHVVVCADRLRSIEKRISAEHLAEFAVRVAGSAADQRDLGFVAGTYGDVGALRFGQLLVADNYSGRVERVRGYQPVTRLNQEGAS